VRRRIFEPLKIYAATPLAALLVLLASACASSHHASPPPTPGTVPSTAGDIDIARVQSSFWGKGFQFFPNGPTRIGCRIPGPGGVGIDGTCKTRVILVRSLSTRALVIFTESWPAKRFRTHGPPRGTLRHSWRFAVKTGGRVARLGDSGAFPPQASD
jgi:hypothetical protein